MNLKEYPSYTVQTLEDVIDVLRQVVFIRKDDIIQARNLPQVFVQGRKVGRVPSSSADIIAGDKIGDFNVTTTYAYYLVDNAGTGEWVRVAVGTF